VKKMSAYCNSISVVHCDKFPDEPEVCELYDCLSPLFRVMEMWGLYFKSNVKRDDCANGNVKQTECSQKTNAIGDDSNKLPETTQKWRRYYAIIVLCILWFNAVRFTTSVKVSEDSAIQLINKLATTSIVVMCAVEQTSYFIASHTGNLDNVLRNIHVTSGFAKRIKRISLVSAVLTFIGCYSSAGYIGYVLFYRGSDYEFILAPFVTHIEIDGTGLIIAKMFCILLDAITKQAFLLPFLMNSSLAYVLYENFRLFNNRFRKATCDHGPFDGDLALFRRRHQALCRDVRQIDQMMMLSNAGCFCCNVFSSVLLLYGFIIVGYPDSATSFLYVFILIGCLSHLVESVVRGIVINHMVYFTQFYVILRCKLHKSVNQKMLTVVF
jgi:hypothetical protein